MSAVSIDESYDIYAIFKQKYDLQNPSKFLTQSWSINTTVNYHDIQF